MLAPSIGHVITASGLRKSYGHVEAVRDIDLEVGAGEIVAFLGPNGAGKTTTLEILAGHRRRDSGDGDVLGYDPVRVPRAFRERIGIVPQETAFEPVLTVPETIALYSAAYPHPASRRRSDRIGGPRGAAQCARQLPVRWPAATPGPGDWDRRGPQLLFLDEPTTGFDPSARRRSWDLIRRLRSLGKTILLTTHYMEEAQRLADRVAVIAAGRIVAEGTPKALSADRPTVITPFRHARWPRHARDRDAHSDADPPAQLGGPPGRRARGPVGRHSRRWRTSTSQLDEGGPRVRLFWLWVQAGLRTVVRTPRSAFFTLIFPVVLLVLIEGDRHRHGGRARAARSTSPSTSRPPWRSSGSPSPATRAWSSRFRGRARRASSSACAALRSSRPPTSRR